MVIVYEVCLGSTHISCLFLSMMVYMCPATGVVDAMGCLPATLCDIVCAALHAFDYFDIAFGGVLTLPVSGTIQGDCF